MINEDCDEKLLYNAVRVSDIDKVCILMGKGVKQQEFLDEVFNEYMMPIHWAVLNMDVLMVDVLLEHGAQRKGSAKCKRTPEMFFGIYCNQKVGFSKEKLEIMKRLIR